MDSLSNLSLDDKAMRDRLKSTILDILPDLIPSIRREQLPCIATKVADDVIKEVGEHQGCEQAAMIESRRAMRTFAWEGSTSVLVHGQRGMVT